jgi:hypothetical protein
LKIASGFSRLSFSGMCRQAFTNEYRCFLQSHTIRGMLCFFVLPGHKNIPACVELSYNQLDINATGEKSLSMNL